MKNPTAQAGLVPSARSGGVCTLVAIFGTVAALVLAVPAALAAPAAPVIVGISPDTGEKDDGEFYVVTTATEFSIDGTAAPNSTVTLYSFGNVAGTTKADEFGHWSIGVKANYGALGFWYYSATATDSTGTSAQSRELTVSPQPPPILRFWNMFANMPRPYFEVGRAVDAEIGDMEESYLIYATIDITGLPPGLRYENGRIIGTPTTAGTFRVTATADNGAAAVSETRSVKVVAAIPPAPPTPCPRRSRR